MDVSAGPARSAFFLFSESKIRNIPEAIAVDVRTSRAVVHSLARVFVIQIVSDTRTSVAIERADDGRAQRRRTQNERTVGGDVYTGVGGGHSAYFDRSVLDFYIRYAPRRHLLYDATPEISDRENEFKKKKEKKKTFQNLAVCAQTLLKIVEDLFRRTIKRTLPWWKNF